MVVPRRRPVLWKTKNKERNTDARFESVRNRIRTGASKIEEDHHTSDRKNRWTRNTEEGKEEENKMKKEKEETMIVMMIL